VLALGTYWGVVVAPHFSQITFKKKQKNPF
jgi:hypothetical protein